MALTLTNPTNIQDSVRDDQADSFNALLGTCELVIRVGATDIVIFPLASPVFDASSSGTLTLRAANVQTIAAINPGTPDSWRLRATGGGAEFVTGGVSGATAIAGSDNVDLTSFSWTEPSS